MEKKIEINFFLFFFFRFSLVTKNVMRRELKLKLNSGYLRNWIKTKITATTMTKTNAYIFSVRVLQHRYLILLLFFPFFFPPSSSSMYSLKKKKI